MVSGSGSLELKEKISVINEIYRSYLERDIVYLFQG